MSYNQATLLMYKKVSSYTIKCSLVSAGYRLIIKGGSMLTDLKIKSLKSGTLKDSDSLYIRVLPSGSKQWYFRIMKDKKRITKSLGIYPAVSIKEARQKVRDYLGITEHMDHATRDPTFRYIYDKWMDFKSKQVKNFREIGLRFENVLLPVFAKRTFGSLETVEVVNILQEYTCQWTCKLESARRIAIWLHQMETFAVNYGFYKYYRFQGITAVIPAPKAKSLSSIHPSGLSAFFDNFKKECRTSNHMLDLTLVGFYTLLRPGEYTAMRWSWIDFYKKTITVPAEMMKMKRPHVVPVCTQLEILLKRLLLTKVNDFVFPSPYKTDNPIVQESMEKFFRNHGGRGVLVPHGIRSIGRTWMTENDIAHDVAELCLAHRIGSETEMAYNRTNLLEKRRLAMQQWCDFVEKCLTAKSGA